MITRDWRTGTIKCLCGSQEFSIREWARSDGTIKLKCLKCGEKSDMKIGNYIMLDRITKNFEGKK